MMLAVNLRTYVKGKIGGLENYVRHVVGGIDRFYADSGQTFTVFAHRAEAENVREIAPHARIIPVVHETAERVMLEELEKGGYDLLFCPLLVLDPLTTTVPSAVMMPDLQHEFFPDFFPPDTLNWRRQAYRPTTVRADRIFTLSNHAKRTIVEKLHADESKIEVVYLDVDEEFRNPPSGEPSEAFRRLGLTGRYFFYPANFWPHKNHSNLLRAFQQVLPTYPDVKLVLTGPAEGRGETEREIGRLGLADKVLLPGYVDRTVLAELYRHASALTFVSRFEGFGIPILEAFHVGVPVISSSAGSCEEVAGGAALLVDPMNPEAIASAMRRVLSDETLCQSLREAGKARAAAFDWRRTVQQTLEAFEQITSKTTALHRIEVNEYPVVSIVTPSYNMARFLRQTVDSVLTQDYPHIDYIVMDGGSKDGTVEILNSYNGKLRFESKPDKGQADAVNKGFAVARGRIFTFLNADDTYLPGAVSAAVRGLMRYPNVGVVYGEANYVHEDGSNIGRYPTLPFDPKTLNRCCYICQPAAFMRSEVFDSAGRMNTELHFALDYDLWIRIAKSYPMLKIDEVLATSRMYRENKTLSRRRPVYMEIMSTAKAHYGYVPFDWVFGYACYVMDRKDQFFDISHPSFSKIMASLVLGSYYNRTQLVRYWHEWATHLGIGTRFSGRYSDGWISKRYTLNCDIAADCEQIRIEGRHLAPFSKGLDLVVKYKDRPLAATHIQQHGPFTAVVECPQEIRGTSGPLVIESGRTFRPGKNGDYRRLSCLIDAIHTGNGKGRE